MKKRLKLKILCLVPLAVFPTVAVSCGIIETISPIPSVSDKDSDKSKDETKKPPSDDGTMKKPVDGGMKNSPGDGEIMNPPGDGGTMNPPGDGGTMNPPGDGGMTNPPGDGEMPPEEMPPIQQPPISIPSPIPGVPVLNPSDPETPPMDESPDQSPEAPPIEEAPPRLKGVSLVWTNEKTPEFESKLTDDQISDADPNPNNLRGSDRIFSIKTIDPFVKSKLPVLKNHFYNTTLHHIILKGGNNLLWRANIWKTLLEQQNPSSKPLDANFNKLFENAVKFNDFKFEIDLNASDNDSQDFLSSFFGTYFMISFFSNQKVLDWYQRSLSPREKEDVSINPPTFLNASIIRRLQTREEFEPQRDLMYKAINYWHGKYWNNQTKSFKFKIEGVTIGGNYALRENIEMTNLGVSASFNMPKFTVEEEKTPIQEYIDGVVKSRTDADEKFLGLFPIIFRNPGTFDLDNVLQVSQFTIFEKAYRDFVLSDRPEQIGGSFNPERAPKRDKFITAKLDKNSELFKSFSLLINGSGKNIYKNSESELLKEGFDPNTLSEITLQIDWNANFIFVFAK